MITKHRRLPPKLSDALTALADNVGIIAIDVGARGEVKDDLVPLGKGLEWFCLEPDTSAPTDTAQDLWKAVHYLPFAAGADEQPISINLYSQRGCSSKLPANRELAGRFSRAHYYDLEDTISLKTRPLDDILAEHTDAPSSYLKIDVQGMEVECFEGAKRLLGDELLAVRTEVSFLPIYQNQPLFAEVDQALRLFGFQPMRWLESHEWRRTTLAKLPKLAQGPLPYSRGQLVHADVLYMRAPDDMPDNTEEAIKQLVRLGLIALCYDLIDHAAAAFERPAVKSFCMSEIGHDPVAILGALSTLRARQYRPLSYLERLLRRLRT